MTKKTWLAALLAVLLSLTIVAPALAIRYGEPDNQRHPYVGLMVAYDEEGTPLWRCSGTLIAPQLFLTAGHCTEDPADHIEIWFDEDLTDAALHNYPTEGDVGGTPYTHPEYDPNAFYAHDLGVVVLDEPIYVAEYGQLPEEGQYDYLGKQRGRVDGTFTAVGIGDNRRPTRIRLRRSSRSHDGGCRKARAPAWCPRPVRRRSPASPS